MLLQKGWKAAIHITIYMALSGFDHAKGILLVKKAVSKNIPANSVYEPG